MDQRTRRIFEARRAGLVARITDGGLPRTLVERLLDTWDDEAYRRGVGRLSPGYWSGAETWIETQRPPARARNGTCPDLPPG